MLILRIIHILPLPEHDLKGHDGLLQIVVLNFSEAQKHSLLYLTDTVLVVLFDVLLHILLDVGREVVSLLLVLFLLVILLVEIDFDDLVFLDGDAGYLVEHVLQLDHLVTLLQSLEVIVEIVQDAIGKYLQYPIMIEITSCNCFEGLLPEVGRLSILLNSVFQITHQFQNHNVGFIVSKHKPNDQCDNGCKGYHFRDPSADAGKVIGDLFRGLFSGQGIREERVSFKQSHEGRLHNSESGIGL